MIRIHVEEEETIIRDGRRRYLAHKITNAWELGYDISVDYYYCRGRVLAVEGQTVLEVIEDE